MNFSENQRTGLLAEQAVSSLMTSWLWTPGNDIIDVGYDLSVEPDRTTYSGSRFLVQVKGTLSKAGKRPVAKVSKARLRQYAVNRTPVFIVRSVPGGALYWLHAQRWCRENMRRLNGEGEAGVVFDRQCDLRDREKFELYLQEVFRPSETRMGALATLAKSREEYLSGLDPRYLVELNLAEGREHYKISLRPTTEAYVDEPIQFLTSEGQRRALIDGLQRHADFGAPFECEVNGMSHGSSALLEELNSQRLKGRIAVAPRLPRVAKVTVQAGSSYDFLAPRVCRDASLFNGAKGAVLEQAGSAGLLQISAKLMPESGQVKGNVFLSLNDDVLYGRALRDIEELETLLPWVDASWDAGSMFVEIEIAGHKPPLRAAVDEIEDFRDIFRWISLIGKASKICQFSGDNFTLRDGTEISEKEAWGIEKGYAVLRGERVSVNLASIQIENGVPPPAGAIEYFLLTSFKVQIGSGVLAEFPVAITLTGYVPAYDDFGVLRSLEKTQDSSATLEFNPGNDPESAAPKRPVLLCKPQSRS